MFVEFNCFNITLNLEAFKNYILKKIIHLKIYVSYDAKRLLTQFFASLWILRWRLKISQFKVKSKPDSNHHHKLLLTNHTQNYIAFVSLEPHHMRTYFVWRHEEIHFKLMSNCAFCFYIYLYMYKWYALMFHYGGEKKL